MASTTDTRLRAGVIGLGMIGGGVAVSMAASGRQAAAVYDVRPDATVHLDGVPDQAESPAAVATVCDVVLLAVVNAEQARDVLAGPDGVLYAARPGLIVVLLSTVGLDAVRDLAVLCAEYQVSLLDASVTNGPQAAANGLVTMVGGPDDVVAGVRPVLEDFSKLVIHCGPLGAGMATKLARNAVTYSMWAAVREAASLAAAAGVEPQRLLQVLENADESTSPLLHLRLLAAAYKIPEEKVAWSEGLADKDLAAAQELAGELGVARDVEQRLPASQRRARACRVIHSSSGTSRAWRLRRACTCSRRRIRSCAANTAWSLPALFDVEVVFLFPWSVLASKLGWMGLAQMLVFLGVLEVGLLYVWRKGALDWR